MPKTLLTTSTLAAALLLSTTALGLTWAAGSDHRRHPGRDARHAVSDGRDGPLRVASEHGGRGRHDGHDRRHSDDDDGDGDDAGSRGGASQARPSGPDAPVPDNGLFSGRARPRVDVQ